LAKEGTVLSCQLSVLGKEKCKRLRIKRAVLSCQLSVLGKEKYQRLSRPNLVGLFPMPRA